jgi:glycine cleavage system H protein
MTAKTETSLRGGAADRSLLKCCWMLAGVVDYKLCDRRYECEGCSFDQAMRNRRFLQAGSEFRHPFSEASATDSLLFHPRHVWARVESAGRIRTGLDDFGRRLAGRIYCVELPEPGTRITAGKSAWTVVHHDGKVSLAAPVAGVVAEVNERLRHEPALVNEDPYGAGWAMVLTPLDLAADLRDLRFGAEIAPWIATESERLGCELASAGKSLPTLMDGGSLVGDLHHAIPSEVRARILDLFLSEQMNRPLGASATETAGESEGR